MKSDEKRLRRARNSLRGPLDNIADAAISKAFAPQAIFADYLIRLFDERGIRLTPEQKMEVRTRCEQPIENLGQLSFNWPTAGSDDAVIEVDDEALLMFATQRFAQREKAYQGLIELTAKKRYDFVVANTKLLLRDFNYQTEMSAAGRKWIWGNSLDDTQAFVCANEAFVEELSPKLLKWRRGDDRVRWTTVLRLHARFCQVAKETVLLLRGGFADGAMARWRTLHEISTTISFLLAFQADVSVRYVEHEAVARWRAMESLSQHAKRVGNRASFTSRDLARQAKLVESLCKRWGDAFRSDFGWASAVLKKKSPNFLDIEDAVENFHAREAYKRASLQVHASPLALEMRESLRNDFRHVLLTGPTDFGFATPIRCTVLTTLLTTQVIVNSAVDLDSLVICLCFSRMSEKLIKESEVVARSQEL